MEEVQIGQALHGRRPGFRLTRAEYETLILKAATQIHLLACYEALDVPDCHHVIAIWSGECMEADAAFQVVFDFLGIPVPPEEPALPSAIVDAKP